MALSNESAGNGSASGSAPQHVPAPLTASPEVASRSPADRVEAANRDIVGALTMLASIQTLADRFYDISDDLEVQSLAQAIGACVDKALRSLESAEAALFSLPEHLRVERGGAQ